MTRRSLTFACFSDVLLPWLHHAPQMRGTDVDAPFNFLADQFSRKYDETMAGLDSMGI